MTDQKPYYQAPYDADQTITSKSVRYGFFGSQGGVSQGLYNSLNCGMGSDDAPQDIAQNRAIEGSKVKLIRNGFVKDCRRSVCGATMQFESLLGIVL